MNKNRTLLVVFVVLLLAGAGISSFVSANSATRVIRDAFVNFSDAESFYAAATVATFASDETVRAAGADPLTTFLPMVFVGEGSMRMPKGGQPSGTASFVLTGKEDASEEMSVEVRALPDGKAFVRLPQVPSNVGDATILGELEGKWFDVPERDTLAVQTAWATVREILTSGRVVGTPVVSRGVKTLGELEVRHYVLPIRQDTLPALAENTSVILHGRPLTDAELADIAQYGLRAGTMELWINTETRQIAQAQLDLRGVEDAGTGDGALRGSYLNVLLKFASWNEPVTVEAPETSEPLPDAVRSIVKPQ